MFLELPCSFHQTCPNVLTFFFLPFPSHSFPQSELGFGSTNFLSAFASPIVPFENHTSNLFSPLSSPEYDMALQTAYKQFLAAPNSSALAANASLHYVTSTTSFSGSTEIIKHFGTLRNQVKKKKESFLSVVEGQNAIAAEIETTLEFVTGGASYLPGLDDNFLTDRIVYLPIVSTPRPAPSHVRLR